MSKGLRLTEKWLNCALWIVALAFAASLIGLGGKLVENLADLEEPPTLEQFIEPARLIAMRTAEGDAQALHMQASEQHDQAVEKHKVAQSDTKSARAAFDNWLATRSATARSEQDDELIARTKALDGLEAAERRALGAVEVHRQALLDATQQADRARRQREDLELPAMAKRDPQECLRAILLCVRDGGQHEPGGLA